MKMSMEYWLIIFSGETSDTQGQACPMSFPTINVTRSDLGSNPAFIGNIPRFLNPISFVFKNQFGTSHYSHFAIRKPVLGCCVNNRRCSQPFGTQHVDTLCGRNVAAV
jgi:hypothetical protein